MMRNAIAIVATIYTGLGLAAVGCGKSGEQEGIEAAKREQEAELKAAAAAGSAEAKAKPSLRPPIPSGTTIPCDQLIDLAGFTAALGEKDPLTFKDLTAAN